MQATKNDIFAGPTEVLISLVVSLILEGHLRMKVLQSPLPDDKNPFEFYNHFGRFAALGENENKSW